MAFPYPTGAVKPTYSQPTTYPTATGPQTFTNPGVPFAASVPAIHEGFMLLLEGFIPSDCNRFCINLQSGPVPDGEQQIPLHLSVRFDEGQVIVRNTMNAGIWGHEERHGKFPLIRGQNFECIIMATSTGYKIAFNKAHFTEYSHRLAKETVTHLSVTGNVQVHKLRFQEGQSPTGHAPPFVHPAHPGIFTPPAPGPGYPPAVGAPPPYEAPRATPPVTPYQPPAPPYQPPRAQTPPPTMPFSKALSGGMYSGRTIHISGTMYSDANAFTIDLVCGNGDIAFHFNPRFAGCVVVRNTMKSGKWGREERFQPTFPFHRHGDFEIIIQCEHNSFKVMVDNEKFTKFEHRIRDLSCIQQLKIHGDVALKRVKIN